jgi:hypothetical protein
MESNYPPQATIPRSQAALADATILNGRSLFAEDELRDLRARWDQVQTGFVDEPRHAVEVADALVTTVEKRVAERFAEELARPKMQWNRAGNTQLRPPCSV